MKSLFKRRSPVDEKNRQLAAEISRLEAEIASLEKAPKSGAPSPRVRSTAYGAVSRSAGGESAARRNASSAPAGAGAGASPGAGTQTRNRATAPSSRRRLMGSDTSTARAGGKRSEGGAGATEVPVNDLGLRKYDLVSAWKRVADHFRGPAPGSSRMVHYLAVGSVQGLRPLRYERRVARNRTLGLTALLLAVLWGLAHVYFKNRGL